MKILVADQAGFCSGVRRAVDLAMEASSGTGAEVTTCGPLVHNPQVTDLLAMRGVTSASQAESIHGVHAIVRSHGLPPEQQELLTKQNQKVTDATCPKVKAVQKAIASHAEEGYRIVIAGEAGHPEVRGLIGYAGKNGFVITNTEQAKDAVGGGEEPICLVAQTTQEPEWFEEVTIALKRVAGGRELKVLDTICNATRNRQKESVSLAAKVDRMIVVGGKTSGNTRRLVQVIEHTGTPVQLVEDETEIQEDAFDTDSTIGVTAGASTPQWAIDRVVERLGRLGETKTRKGRLTGLLRTAVASSAFSTFAAFFLNLAAALLLGAVSAWRFALLGALYLFAMQVINRLAEVDSARFRDDPTRMDLFAKYSLPMRVLAAFATGGALLLAATMGNFVLVMTAGLCALGVLYAYPVFPGRKTRRKRALRIKDMPASKNLLVSVAWTTMAVVPAWIASAPAFTTALAVFLCMVITIGIRTVHLDLADMRADKLLGRDTVPTLLGERKAGRLLKTMALLLVALLAAFAALHVLHWVSGLLAILLAVEMMFLGKDSQPKKSRWRSELLFDLHFIAAGVLVLLVV